MKKNKGVTLAMLIIIITLLVILAGATISFMLKGEMIEGAEKTVNKTEQQVETQEQISSEVRNLYK